MSNPDIICKCLAKGETVYLKDDFYDAAIRIAGGTETYLKHKGRHEFHVPYSHDLLCQIELGGDFISKEEYENY